METPKQPRSGVRQFAAIEQKQGVSPHAVVHEVMKAAMAKSKPFMSLELLGILNLGRLRFIRIRFESHNLRKVLDELDCGVILPEGGSYVLKFPDTEPKKVSIVTMQLAGDPAIRRVYRGPGVKFWERQFL